MALLSILIADVHSDWPKSFFYVIFSNTWLLQKKDTNFSVTYHLPVKYGLGAVARQLVRKFIGTKREVK